MSGQYARYPVDGGAGVVTLNGLSGALTLAAGTNITITPSGGDTLTISATGGGGGGIASINADTTADQLLTVGTSGTNFAIVDAGSGSHVFNLPTASAANRGALSAADWSTFNGKQNALTIGNLTDAGTDGIVVTGGTGAVIGSGTSLAQHVADSTHNGYLSSADWSTFNGKQGAGNYITGLTGDGTASGPGSAAFTLAAVASAGTTGSSTSIPAVTINAKGLVTSVSGNAVIAPAGTLTGTTLASNVVTSSLTSVGTIGTGVWHGTAIDNVRGGTGGDSSGSTGIAHVAAGAWSYAAVNLSNSDVTGTLGKGNGGTGQTTYTDGQLLIGNTTGNTLTKATLTAGTGISVTNAGGSITIANTIASPRSYYIHDTFNSLGGSSSGDTKVINFTNQRASAGTNITYTARTTTAGDKWTVNADGVYAVTFNFAATASGSNAGIVINGTALSTNVQTPLTYAQGLRTLTTDTGSGTRATSSWTGFLSSGDIIRIQGGGDTLDATSATMVTICQVSG